MNPVLKEITKIDKKVKRNLTTANTEIPEHVDILFKWLPITAVVLAGATGVKTKSPFVKRIIIIIMSEAILNSHITPLKKFINRRRPGSFFNYNSFPSRHTAVSFCGAEILYREAAERLPFLAITGYASAITTASLRVYRRKHWLSDAITGAIIGVVSAKLSYFLFKKIFNHVNQA